MNAIDILMITKTASVSSIALKEILHSRDFAYKNALSIAKHFKVPVDESETLFTKKLREASLNRHKFPLEVNILTRKNPLEPQYFPGANIIDTYKEPWSFMHEFAHADMNRDYMHKLKSILPLKTRLSAEESKLLNNYVQSFYASGDSMGSTILGNRLLIMLDESKKFKQKDTLNFINEIKASARAISDTERLHSRNMAEKVFQPSAALDAGAMRAWEKKKSTIPSSAEKYENRLRKIGLRNRKDGNGN